MKIVIKFQYLLFILVQFYTKGNGDRIKDRMYEDMDASKACFRRLNGTHQIGCSTDRDGSTGVVHFCTDQNDLEFILEKGNAPPYIPIIPTQFFTRANVKRCIKSEKISGLILYRDGSKVNNFTHENQCPNYPSNIANTCKKWNPEGTGLLYEDIPFPVFYLEGDKDVHYARNCYNAHNNFSFETQRDRSLCVMQLSFFMYASTDTPTCLRRSNSYINLNPVKMCDPLGDQNVWSSLFPMAGGEYFTEPLTSKYIVIAARMDTTSMFEKTAGAESPVTGIVALLTIAKLLKKMLPENNSYDKNVLFILFNGETYDYIGSQRFIYDLKRNETHLPRIRLKDISLFIELSQLGNSGTLYSHYLYPKDELSHFLNILSSNAQNVRLSMSNGTLPPSSFHTFLKADENIPGIILADHQEEYFNKFYNSIYDNSSNIAFTYFNDTNDITDKTIQKWIKNISEVVAKSVYEELIKKPYQGNAEGDLQLVNELFHCYLENSNCKVHQAVQKSKLKNEPPSLYVSVDAAKNPTTAFIGLTLSWLTADDIGEGNLNCTKPPGMQGLTYFNMSKSLDELNTTRCFRVSMNFTEAVSPAFVIENYNWSSGVYSTWAESTWGEARMRVFLQPSKAHESLTISIGSMILIFSFLLTYFVKSRSDILFALSLPTIAPTNC